MWFFIDHGWSRTEEGEQVDRSQRTARARKRDFVEREVAIVRVPVRRIELADDLARINVHFGDVPGVPGREVRAPNEELSVR